MTESRLRPIWRFVAILDLRMQIVAILDLRMQISLRLEHQSQLFNFFLMRLIKVNKKPATNLKSVQNFIFGWPSFIKNDRIAFETYMTFCSNLRLKNANLISSDVFDESKYVTNKKFGINSKF
jgi:hypothetical protein